MSEDESWKQQDIEAHWNLFYQLGKEGKLNTDHWNAYLAGKLNTTEPSYENRMRAADICTKAAQIVAGDREAQHGPKERNFQNIADHWNAYLGQRVNPPISALDVGLMMVELKVARTKAGSGLTNLDNYIDMAGYAGCCGEIALGEIDQTED